MVINCKELKKMLVNMLKYANIPDYEFDVNCMIEQVTGMSWHRILVKQENFSSAQMQELLAMTERRISGEPLQYILGEWEFYGMRLFVGTGVLIPRADTELLIDTVLDLYQDKNNLKILDLCTGSGCIALALRKYIPNAEITGIDISERALYYAEKNKNYHGLDINFMLGDVLDDAVAQKFENLDLLISNPPYLTRQEMENLQKEVSYEPVSALAGGFDGLDFYKNITSIWKNRLKQNGLLIYEIGCQQGNSVAEILKINNFENIRVMQDLEHRDRVVLGFKK